GSALPLAACRLRTCHELCGRDGRAECGHVALKHRPALGRAKLPERLIFDDKVAIVAAVAQDAYRAGEIEVALVQRAAVLAVLVADFPMLLPEFRWVADTLDVGVDGSRGVLTVDLVDA